MSAADKLAIIDAIDAYLALADDPAVTAVAGMFMPDAVWECYAEGARQPSLRFASLAALESALAQARNGPRLRHHRTGLRFDHLAAGTARTTVKVLVTEQDGDAAPPRLANVACEIGTWRKTAFGWKVASWTVYREIL